jgi:hypothetical protein
MSDRQQNSETAARGMAAVGGTAPFGAQLHPHYTPPAMGRQALRAYPHKQGGGK